MNIVFLLCKGSNTERSPRKLGVTVKLLALPPQTLSHVRHCLWLPWPPLHVLKTWQRPFLGLHCANLQSTFIIHLLPVEGAKEGSQRLDVCMLKK